MPSGSRQRGCANGGLCIHVLLLHTACLRALLSSPFVCFRLLFQVEGGGRRFLGGSRPLAGRCLVFRECRDRQPVLSLAASAAPCWLRALPGGSGARRAARPLLARGGAAGPVPGQEPEPGPEPEPEPAALPDSAGLLETC